MNWYDYWPMLLALASVAILLWLYWDVGRSDDDRR